MRTEIGKIKYVSFGQGGYQDAMIGITFQLGSDKGSWGVGDFWGAWSHRSEGARWSEQDRIEELGKVVLRINDLLNDAKVRQVSELNGIPVEVTFEGMSLKSWRILTEVI